MVRHTDENGNTNTYEYAYDANHNLIRVTDWSNRVTAYTYDVNNRVTGVTKPDGSTTTTVYDSKQRVASTVERTASGTVITGFEYTYDDLSRIIEEKVLANSTKMCYTYDSLSRVTTRTIRKVSDNSLISTETFNYDAAGNLTDAPDSCFGYNTNNRLVVFNGNTVSYDLDGNMLSNGSLSCTYDSANRLISAGGHTYTYNAEDVRIRNLCTDEDTTYTYDTNGKLSKLLCKTTGGVTTKYVYGRGLIGEEVNSTFKTYHFDCRGSTIAITDASGNITETFAYDTYGKLLSRTGTSKVIFGYNGRDGVITDDNGLYYMRARYYSPSMKRFINADVIAGAISNAITLNRFAYANGNPVSFVDPFGLTTVAIFFGGETDLDPTDDYEFSGSGGGSSSSGYGYSGYGYSGYGCSGYDSGVSSGGSYHNYLVRNGTANYDASLGGYHYQGTSTSFSNISQYYVPGAVSVDDSMAKEIRTNSLRSQTDNPHGNSKSSTKKQHGYEIYEIDGGNVVKTGISGQPLNQNNTSPRANRQVNQFNNEAGEIKYDSRIMIKDVGSRTEILRWETENTKILARAGNNMYKQKLPPWKPYSSRFGNIAK
jgi:RHS repeat-associated protein